MTFRLTSFGVEAFVVSLIVYIRRGSMPRGTRHTVTGILHLAPRGFELHVDDGGIWALDISSWRRTRNMVGQRVTVVGTRSGFDLLDVHEIWTGARSTRSAISTFWRVLFG